jgi:hypothetical protein
MYMEAIVPEAVLSSGWETLLFAVPFVGILLAGMFGLDQLMASARFRRRPIKQAISREGTRQPIYSDQDRKPWKYPS